ncbi:MAG: hypothetical protein JWN30_1045 [Bacilli bacterium]|nr:hypothetical protein [Bacilli bacterium]
MRNIKWWKWLTVVMSFVLLTVVAGKSQASQSQYQDNGTFLSHNYVKYSSYVNLVPDLANKMQNTYKVSSWFNNAGTLTSAGSINKASTELAQVKNYMNAVKTYENANGFTFKVYAWLSADSSVVDLSNATVRSAIVEECKKLTSTTEPGSYVSGANRAFDGVMMDIEPSGNNDTLFNNYKQLMDDIKNGIGSSKLTGVAAHKLGTSASRWYWSPSYYYDMGRHVNVIVDMAYDTGLTAGTAYQGWMQAQVKSTMDAVSGKTWNNDANHPVPTNGIKVFIGLPAYPVNSNHNLSVENMQYGAQGLVAGITDLLNDSTDNSEAYFQGAAVYLHSNGSGSDGYAGWNTDWYDYGHYWLGAVYNLDKTPPTTTDNAPTSWVNTDVTVKLIASDSGSGVAATYYTVDGGLQQSGTTVIFTTEGVHTLTYWSVDNAGNVETANTATVMIDKTPPVTSASVSPSMPNGSNGWYTSDVIINVAATDNLSSVARTEYRVNNGTWVTYTGSIPSFGEGVYQVAYRSTDQAGNVEQMKSIGFKIDETAPELTVQLDKTVIWPPDNKMKTIKAMLNASDDTSGVASIVLTSITSNEPDSGQGDIQANFGSTDTSFSLRAARLGTGTGRFYTITYMVTDNAGNTSTAISTVSVPHNQ